MLRRFGAVFDCWPFCLDVAVSSSYFRTVTEGQTDSDGRLVPSCASLELMCACSSVSSECEESIAVESVVTIGSV